MAKPTGKRPSGIEKPAEKPSTTNPPPAQPKVVDDPVVARAEKAEAEVVNLRKENSAIATRSSDAEKRLAAVEASAKKAEAERDKLAEAAKKCDAAKARRDDCEARRVAARNEGLLKGALIVLFPLLLVVLAYLTFKYIEAYETIDATHVTEFDVPLPVAKPVVGMPAAATNVMPTVPPPRAIEDCLGGPDPKPRSRVEACCNSIVDRHTRAMCLSTMYSLLVPHP